MKKSLLLLLILASYKISHCQNKQIIDSLYGAVKKTVEPEQKLHLLYTLYMRLRLRDSIECENIAVQGLLICRELKNKIYESLFYSGLAHLYARNNNAKSLIYINKALLTAGQTSDNKCNGMAYYKLGVYYDDNNNTDSALYAFFKAEQYLPKSDDCTYTVNLYQRIASLYSDLRIYDKQLKYARICYDKALVCSNPDALLLANFVNAVAHDNVYQFDSTANKNSKDSALYYYKNIIELSHLKTISKYDVISSAYYNVGVMYYQKNKADSALFYFDKSIEADSLGNNKPTACLLRLLKSKILIEKKQLLKAGDLLDIVKTQYIGSIQDPYILTRYYEVKSLFEKANGNFEASLANKQLQLEFADSVYNDKKLATIQKVETEFTNYKQQQQLREAEAQVVVKKKLNYFYLAIAILSLLGSLFMFRSYHFWKKGNILKQKILYQQKGEAELQSRLSEKENQNLRLEKNLQEEQKQKYQMELMATILQIERKNELLIQLQAEMNGNTANATGAELKKINKIINESFTIDDDFGRFKKNFENVYPEFFIALQQKAADTLTQLDLKYCAYIKMGLSNKEIASLLHVEPKSVHMTRYRMRQKMQLSEQEDLTDFISNIK